MPEIKFSHEYLKFENCEEDNPRARLLETFIVNRKELHKSFVKYDTEYYIWKTKDVVVEKYYKLPTGKLIVLLFWSATIGLFTTIRSWNPKKEEYYRSKRGEIFDVVIEEKE